MLKRAFTGFAAITSPDWKKPWREVFGVKADWTGNLTELYRTKARTRHPRCGRQRRAYGRIERRL
jgi:hypothetical protein